MGLFDLLMGGFHFNQIILIDVAIFYPIYTSLGKDGLIKVSREILK